MKQDLSKFQLQHRHGGNGWIIVQDLPRDMCRVAMACPEAKKFCNQAFLAWKNLLSVEMRKQDPMAEVSPLVPVPIPPHLTDVVIAVRKALESGEKKVVATRIV